LHLNDQVKMVGHQTEGVNSGAELIGAKGKQVEEVAIIVVDEEELFALIAAIDAVVERSGKMDARFASHTDLPPKIQKNKSGIESLILIIV
jgi:hypothetical protein